MVKVVRLGAVTVVKAVRLIICGGYGRYCRHGGCDGKGVLIYSVLWQLKHEYNTTLPNNAKLIAIC